MAGSILTEPKSTPSGFIIVFIGRSSAAPGEQVKREWLLETLHWVEQMHLEEYGSLDSRSVDFIPFIQGKRVQMLAATCFVISGWDGLTTSDLTLGFLGQKAEGVDVALRFCVEENDDGSRRFHDVKLRDAYRVWSDESKSQWLQCSFCEAEFSKPWSRHRHVKVSCLQNPDSEKNKPATKPRKKRGTMVRVAGVKDQPTGSDNGLTPYMSIDPADYHKAPRIDPENPMIYRGELFCRHPDCSSKKVTRYTQKSIVRKHYWKDHGMEYRQFSKTLGAFEEKPHVDGLQ
ncbi:hypothetical protein N7471_003840 [Penicillium samsonianum]|uniref:uncharacterized protein n=1 Tax=Penicillium samsonianum TaxID=1882272 RepID=UPI002548D965|nr:uncharacterized protein N7471_003840 [Penicillium samsonianum]KAJ6137354.1 hypothetical protein N7471_003840 [Penicillium samsonianum]